MLLSHALTLCRARSCLASLTDGTASLGAARAYDTVLVVLDSLHGDEVPALETDALTHDRPVLYEMAFDAIEELASHGVDELQVELLLAMLADARDLEPV